MSHNLCACIRQGKKEEIIRLWQTPTHITDMLLVDADGRKEEKRGRDALRVLRAYCEWVMGEAQSEFNRTRGAYDISAHKEHVEGIMRYVRKASPDLVVGRV